jgi:hypothetical protein
VNSSFASFFKSKRPFAFYSLLICFSLSIYYLKTNRLNEQRWKEVIVSDGIGYYSYLPALFIYDDLNYSYFYSDSLDYVAIRFGPGSFCYPVDNKAVNKYYCGEAIVMAPFFFLAEILTYFSGNARDGYSFYYQASVSIAGLFYFLFGLWMLILFLRNQRVKEINIALVILLFFLGTNLFYYVLEQPYMSHGFSFSFVCWWLRISDLQAKNPKNYRWFLLAFIAGIITLIRPVNAILLLSIFAVYPQLKDFKVQVFKLFKQPLVLLVSILIFFSIIGIQSLLYYKACGKFWVDSYGNEGFNFASPEVWNVLFSFRKGLFIYTPILLLTFIGFFYFSKNYGITRLIILCSILVLFTYVISSWWYWAYGGSFGMRPFVEVYPLFIWIFSISLNNIKSYISKVILTIISVFCIYLNQVQLYQSTIGILPYENLNFEKYKRLFLRTQVQFAYMFPSLPEPPKSELINGHIIGGNFNGFEENYGQILPFITTKIKSKGNKSACVNKDLGGLAHVFEFPLNKLIPTNDTLGWVVINADILLENVNENPSFILSLANNEDVYFFELQFLIHQIHINNKWVNCNFYYKIPEMKSINDKMQLSISNNNMNKVFIDQLNLTFYSRD